ncbi:MAG: TonB-dependent receptor domain-containing protein, partial [Novosphingobium sp.]
MKTLKKTALSLETAALAIALAGLGHSTAAFAQDAAPAPAADCVDSDSNGVCDSEEKGSAIVVTGSRIKRPNLTSEIPITAVAGEEFFQQGQNSVGDALNDLPQLRSTFAQQNPGAGVGIAGLNLLDLRGLGTVRTLVLVNGRRHVASDILNNASSPDVNTIPNDLIERVDIVTGGNSAVYGSDAIAGVVNFVLRRNYSGVQIRANAGIAEAGFGANQYVSVMAGKNFADGRGNVTVHAEYAHSERVYAADVPWFRQADGFATVDVDSGGLPNGSDGFPDAVFVRDIRSATIHRWGLVPIVQPQTGAQCGQGTLANNGPANTLGTAFDCNYIFNADGRLQAQTGTRFGSGPAGTIVGGNGQTSREGTQLSILPSNQRINANLLAHYEFSPALEAFIEAKFVHVNAVGNQLGPTFVNGSFGSVADTRINPRLDNPFLNPADRALIANGYLANNCTFTAGSSIAATTCTDNTPAAGDTVQTLAAKASRLAARNAAIANGSYRFLFARNLTDSPDRDEYFTRDTYRIVGGLKGTFNGDWSYELSANYGEFKETADMHGFVNRQRFVLSLDAGLDPATNTIKCRSQYDAASATGYNAASYPGGPAALAADIAACVPYNPFGAGNNQAAVAYFAQRIVNHSSISQFDVTGFVNGDTSGFFNFQGGPIGFVVGGEFRSEKVFNDSDSAADTGISNSVFLGDVNPPALKVKEAFGELRLPILKDVPFFRELSFSGAARISDYNTSLGTVFTYNVGAEWVPVEGVRFRANYGRAIRAPNVTEYGFPNVPNFANAFIDPCNVNAIGNNAIRNTNCTTQLTASQLSALPVAGYSLGIISGSNPNLKEETSTSYTYGVVLTPSFLPGFSLTADYYNITVKNVITTLTAQTIVNSCYDSPNLSSPLCNVFSRNLNTSNGVKGELPGQILFNTLVAGPQNFARRVRRGLDIEAAYRRDLGDGFKMGTRLIYSHAFTISNFENPTLPNFENRILEELGDP